MKNDSITFKTRMRSIFKNKIYDFVSNEGNGEEARSQSCEQCVLFCRSTSTKTPYFCPIYYHLKNQHLERCCDIDMATAYLNIKSALSDIETRILYGEETELDKKALIKMAKIGCENVINNAHEQIGIRK